MVIRIFGDKTIKTPSTAAPLGVLRRVEAI
jgi:hypothetical protein